MDVEAIPVTIQDTRKNPARIVVGVDGSAESKAALRWAAKLAPALGCAITAMTAWQFPAVVGMSPAVMNVGMAPYFPESWHPEQDARDLLDSTVQEVFADERPVDLVLSIAYGQPASVLLEASEDSTMLIVGSRGHGGFAGLLLGSVSSACAEHATCPVLVVHGV
jgi:nucleotide-binding universal stress UspA family protein